MKAVSVHGFAGAFDLGIAQAGGEIIGKMEGSKFGAQAVDDNRHLVGEFPIITTGPDTWEDSLRPDLVFGNPPCSGFSALSVYQYDGTGDFRDGRGTTSHLNRGMYELIDYASAVKPDVVAFESVAAAGVHGRSLMRELRDRLETQTGLRYHLTHVFQDNASVGGVSIRRRYHFVAHRFDTLGMDLRIVDHVPTLLETIGDLVDAPLGSVNGHVCRDSAVTHDVNRLVQQAAETDYPWRWREKVGFVTCRLAKGDEVLMKSLRGKPAVPIPARCFDCADLGSPAHVKLATDVSWVRNIHWKSNLYAAIRWAGDKPAVVATGHFLTDAIHPTLDRAMTYREEARIQGFPDDWSLTSLLEDAYGHAWLGKGVPVQAGRWLGEGIKRSLDGDPGPRTGWVIGDRERVIDVTGEYRTAQVGMFG